MIPMMLSLTLLACGDKDDSGGGEFDAILALTGNATAGATVYSQTCASCHAADGTGDTGPSLVEHSPLHGDEELLGIILNGSGDMAPVPLEDQEAADVLAYLRATFG